MCSYNPWKNFVCLKLSHIFWLKRGQHCSQYKYKKVLAFLYVSTLTALIILLLHLSQKMCFKLSRLALSTMLLGYKWSKLLNGEALNLFWLEHFVTWIFSIAFGWTHFENWKKKKVGLLKEKWDSMRKKIEKVFISC